MSALEAESLADFQTEKRRQHIRSCFVQALDEIENLSEARYTLHAYVDSVIHSFIADEAWISIEDLKNMSDEERKRVTADKIKRAIFATENLSEISANLLNVADRFNEMVFDHPWTRDDFPRTRRCRHNPRPVLD